jgi:hypothetical protein
MMRLWSRPAQSLVQVELLDPRIVPGWQQRSGVGPVVGECDRDVRLVEKRPLCGGPVEPGHAHGDGSGLRGDDRTRPSARLVGPGADQVEDLDAEHDGSVVIQRPDLRVVRRADQRG